MLQGTERIEAYVVRWHKNADLWPDYDDAVKSAAAGQIVRRWLPLAKKSATVGSPVLLNRTGTGREYQRGVVGSGYIAGPGEDRPHHMPKSRTAGRTSHFVPIDFDILLPIEQAVIVYSDQTAYDWINGPGTLWEGTFSEAYTNWLDHVLGVSPARDDESLTGWEGGRRLSIHISGERDQRLVADAKKRHARKHNGRLPCELCTFDFVECYGPAGEGFAEAHHRTPLHKLNGPTLVSSNNLAIVCANCHRMLHRSGPDGDTIRAMLDNGEKLSTNSC